MRTAGEPRPAVRFLSSVQEDGNGSDGLARVKRGDLSRTQVVEAALECLDRVGIGGFSVREVARAIGVFPTALYWHVPGGRNELLAAAAGAALQDVLPLDAAMHWQDWLLDLFRRYRRAVQAHPNVAPLLGSQLVSNAGVDLDLVEALLATLRRAGFGGEALRDAYNVSVAAMLGFTTLEYASMPGDDVGRWQEALRTRLDDAGRPELAAHRDLLFNRAFIVRWQNGREAPMDSGFEAFARATIDGLAVRLDRGGAAPGGSRWDT